ncbi:MAG TPA: cystathionine beta-lyase [Gammaproteobacteria bacterium]|nr:cystathionine beta-lyase [Gammaproteobacteria bacterium]
MINSLPTDPGRQAPETLITHLGNHPKQHNGIINMPVYHASTILFPDLASLRKIPAHKDEPGQLVYGRTGTPTSFALQDAISTLENGYQSYVTCSGLAAITTAILAFVDRGDHILVADSVYGPTRHFCDGPLARLGVQTTYYDPTIGTGIGNLITSNTRFIYTESPGSLTFEIQDLPAISTIAHQHNILVLMDNTWATPLYFQPFSHGVDVSIHAATKYIVGHADAMLGLIVANKQTNASIRDAVWMLGQCAGPDDIYLALRGLRTLATRLQCHQDNALVIAHWLQQQPAVLNVLHPGLPDHPGHILWQRDFTGSSGLFSFILKPGPERALAAMLDDMRLFGMGFSWGGYESLMIPTDPAANRTVRPWSEPGNLLRVHIGLEAVDDLITDLALGLERYLKYCPQ